MTEASTAPRIAVLAGGVGAARFCDGLQQVVPDPAAITVIGNTADDLELWGLHISPDLDSVLYTMAGRGDVARGWGLAGESFTTAGALRALGEEVWFNLGDRDLATHLFRTSRLLAGASLGQVTDELRRRLGVVPRLLPMTDDPVRTIVETDAGQLAFQDWFVRRACRDRVDAVRFVGLEAAQPGPGVAEALAFAEIVFIAPSNPFVSIDPILALPGVRDALRHRRGPVVAVTPIIGGAAVKGPAAAMLASLGHDVSALGVARHYRDVASHFLLDAQDVQLAAAIEGLGLVVAVADTLMQPVARRADVARAALALAG